MSVNRHLSRTVAVQALFEWDMREGSSLEEIVNRGFSLYPKDVDKKYLTLITGGVKQNAKLLDKKILEVAPDFPIDQVSPIDKAVLRVAIYEVLFMEDIPEKVSINEAVELSKTFGGENSYKFVNGVLGSIYKKISKSKSHKVSEKIKPIKKIV